MSTLSALSDRTHYLVIAAVQSYDPELGIETQKFQILALPYAVNTTYNEPIVWDSNEETGEQNHHDDYKTAKDAANYYTRGMMTRRFMEDYLGLLTNSRADLFGAGAVERTVDHNDVKYHVNKAVICRNVKDEMRRVGYTEEFSLAMGIRVIRENMSRIMDLI